MCSSSYGQSHALFILPLHAEYTRPAFSSLLYTGIMSCLKGIDPTDAVIISCFLQEDLKNINPSRLPVAHHQWYAIGSDAMNVSAQSALFKLEMMHLFFSDVPTFLKWPFWKNICRLARRCMRIIASFTGLYLFEINSLLDSLIDRGFIERRGQAYYPSELLMQRLSEYHPV